MTTVQHLLGFVKINTLKNMYKDWITAVTSTVYVELFLSFDLLI